MGKEEVNRERWAISEWSKDGYSETTSKKMHWERKKSTLDSWPHLKSHLALLSGSYFAPGKLCGLQPLESEKVAWGYKFPTESWHQEVTFPCSLADIIRQWPLLHMLFNVLCSAENRSIHSTRADLNPSSSGTASSLQCHFLQSQYGSFISSKPWHCSVIYLSNNEQQAAATMFKVMFRGNKQKRGCLREMQSPAVKFKALAALSHLWVAVPVVSTIETKHKRSRQQQINP